MFSIRKMASSFSVLALCVTDTSTKIVEKFFCAKCGLLHPNILQIPPKEKVKDSGQAEGKSEITVDSTLVSSGLTGAGDHDCKLPIVPVQVKSKKGSNIITTYAFLDQGRMAVICTKALMHKLGLTGKKARIFITDHGPRKGNEQPYCLMTEGGWFKTFTQECMPVHSGNIPRKGSSGMASFETC